MQIYARDDQGRFIHATHARRQKNYCCTECGRSVRLRGGPSRRAHFYHPDPDPSCSRHRKGIIHLQLQEYFLNRLTPEDCRIEHRFPEVNRIADVAWLSKKIVFEIQCSPVSPAEVLERNRDYASSGWTVIWILHDRRYNQIRLSSAEAALRHFPHYFTDMDDQGKGMIYDQFDRADRGVRKDRLAGLPIDFCKTIPLDRSRAFNELELLQMRSRHRSFAFEGDLFSVLLNDPSSDYIRLAKEREARARTYPERLSLFFVLKRFWLRCISDPYRILFRYILERSCR